MRYPKHLPEHGTIGFVAPSFGCNIEPYRTAFENAQKKLKELGHNLELGPNCYEGKGIGISNTPEACGVELTEYYCRRENDVLISCGGGELMCETVSNVDFERIRAAEPKWYMGFSDNTNMTFLLATLCDTAAIYGPCAAAFGMEPWHESISDAYRLLRGEIHTVSGYKLWEKEALKDEEHPLLPYNVTEKRRMRVFLPAKCTIEEHAGGLRKPEEVEQSRNQACEAGMSEENPKVKGALCEVTAEDTQVNIEGRLIGGCLDCLVNLLGTEFDRVPEFAERYREDGIVWFLEACDLNVMAIRRAIWQMKHAGWFAHVKGVLVGRPLVFGQVMMGLDQYRAVCDLLAEYQVPVIMDVDLGHLPPMMPVICGSYAKITTSGNDISIEMIER